MFFNATAFNQSITPWRLNSVQGMARMFDGAVAFNQVLGDDWTTTTANKYMLFANGCPGRIAGKVAGPDGSVA